MVPLANVNNHLAIVLQWGIGEDVRAQTKLHAHYSDSSPPSGANLNTLAGVVHTAYATNLKPLCTSQVTLRTILITDLSDNTIPVGIWTGSEVGSLAAGGNNPANICVCMNHKVARRYKGGHPRNYFPFGGTLSQSDAQTWSGGFIGTVNTGWANFAGALLGATPPPQLDHMANVSYVLGHHYHGEANAKNKLVIDYRTSPLTEPIVSTTANTRICTQNRRLLH